VETVENGAVMVVKMEIAMGRHASRYASFVAGWRRENRTDGDNAYADSFMPHYSYAFFS